MLDFVKIKTSAKATKRKDGTVDSVVRVSPEFIVKASDDLMVKGSSFYAVWDEDSHMWSTDPGTVCRLVDSEIDAMAIKVQETDETAVIEKMYLHRFSTKKWSEFLSYCNSLPDNYHELDTRLTFAGDEVCKEDYVSKRVSYSLAPGSIDAWDELMGVLYDPSERQKLEWAIGSIVAGDSVRIQKFLVLYGSAGTGKSTFLNIVQQLFDGYYNTFEAKALASSNNSFALEMFRNNPLVSIQHDGDLSRIEDNTKLNSIVSHEEMVVNEKRKSQYTARFNTFIFMGTNKPVYITDAKSGILRRLIDVKPSGNTVDFSRYQVLMSKIHFELGAIAYHCMEVYKSMGIYAYDKYVPREMMGATNDFYNFILDNIMELGSHGGITLSDAWRLYTHWCDDADVKYRKSKRQFKEELKNYYDEFRERSRDGYGNQGRNFYLGFQHDKFKYMSEEDKLYKPLESNGMLELDETESVFDKTCFDSPAQYANEDGTPTQKWSNVSTVLHDIDTSKLHYVKVPSNHIVIDFDLKDDSGEKSKELNLKAAANWPTTYAEFSKSGKGVHLHYYYDGDVSQLSNSYSEGIEVKVFTGNSSLRRQFTKCNGEEIATLKSGLPLKKGGGKVLDFEGLKNEKALRTLIAKNLRKEIHPGTKPSVEFICKILNDAYESGMHYDVNDMLQDILTFANNSTHHSLYCVKLVNQAHFNSDEPSEIMEWDEDTIVFYDVEVFPNLFIIVWKAEDSDQCVRMINPTPKEVENLIRFKLIGFNNRRYDNHILYSRIIGGSNEDLYRMSKRIIGGGREGRAGFHNEGWGLAYADIYDYSSKKQSLKKWEIELGIHHQELGLPWDDPVPEDLWEKVAEYCENDVRATEAVFKATYDDYVARCLLADLSGLSVAHTTRQHGTRIIFGNDRNPQASLVYTDLSELFPGYTFDHGVSSYMGENPSEGGYVYAEPGYYENVALLDVASMHPTSLIELDYLGPYTQRFKDLLDARLAIKHGDHDTARTLLDGKLAKYIDDPDISDKKLSYALKIIINSVYGWTAATKFDCEFHHPDNVDNIVAKRGALFMISLKHEVQKRGYTVAHIKTDSIKIPDADDDIISFVMEYGKKYGYTFEHEDTYEKFCLVNNSVYICYSKCHQEWEPTGAQFMQPYVLKTLFTKEPLRFSDFCETKSVSVGEIYLDMNEKLPDDEHDLQYVGRVGLFTPVLPGTGGGILYRVADEQLYSVTGTKGYRWLESENVKLLGKENDIDYSYYDALADQAIETIENYVPYNKLIGKEQ